MKSLSLCLLLISTIVLNSRAETNVRLVRIFAWYLNTQRVFGYTVNDIFVINYQSKGIFVIT